MKIAIYFLFNDKRFKEILKIKLNLFNKMQSIFLVSKPVDSFKQQAVSAIQMLHKLKILCNHIVNN